MAVEHQRALEHFQALELSPEATAVEIREAYFRLVLSNHPDRNLGDPAAEARFKKIQRAYEVLSAPGVLTRYRQFLRTPFQLRASDTVTLADVDANKASPGLSGSARRDRRHERHVSRWLTAAAAAVALAAVMGGVSRGPGQGQREIATAFSTGSPQRSDDAMVSVDEQAGPHRHQLRAATAVIGEIPVEISKAASVWASVAALRPTLLSLYDTLRRICSDPSSADQNVGSPPRISDPAADELLPASRLDTPRFCKARSPAPPTLSPAVTPAAANRRQPPVSLADAATDPLDLGPSSVWTDAAVAGLLAAVDAKAPLDPTPADAVWEPAPTLRRQTRVEWRHDSLPTRRSTYTGPNSNALSSRTTRRSPGIAGGDFGTGPWKWNDGLAEEGLNSGHEQRDRRVGRASFESLNFRSPNFQSSSSQRPGFQSTSFQSTGVGANAKGFQFAPGRPWSPQFLGRGSAALDPVAAGVGFEPLSAPNELPQSRTSSVNAMTPLPAFPGNASYSNLPAAEILTSSGAPLPAMVPLPARGPR